ncbi:MAG: sorbosone dehydrogenase family protein [Sphingorhabdus sp.]
MWKHIRNLAIIFVLLGIGVFWYLSRPDVAQLEESELIGVISELPAARAQTIPTMEIAEADRWTEKEKPVAAAGLKVEAFASGLAHPRNIYVLPNGDVLVAETNSPPRENSGIEGFVAKYLMDKAGAGVPSANRITLLRDTDGDGTPELKSEFLTGLNSPFGMVLVGETLYVANTDAVLAFPYKDGDTKIAAKGEKIYALNAKKPNNHWTRNLVASADGKLLYIAVGSNSNIGENGMDTEKGRAMVIEYDIKEGAAKPLAVGLRNPVGLDFDSQGELWTVVNERDMLGSDLVPDYLAQVEWGADFGWPQHYWVGYVDDRVKPAPKKGDWQYIRRPDFALGAHGAPLGLAFANSAQGTKASLGEAFASGAFIARHGSWNRKPVSGYDVVFVKFSAKGKPVGKFDNVLTGFLDADGKAQGRPTMLAIAKDGALLVSDDVGNVIWRVTLAAAKVGS